MMIMMMMTSRVTMTMVMMMVMMMMMIMIDNTTLMLMKTGWFYDVKKDNGITSLIDLSSFLYRTGCLLS